jgi:hypothetical protein
MTSNIPLDSTKTKIVILADVSGSMESMGSIPQIKINEFVKEQKGDVLVDVWTFNERCKNIYTNIKSSDFNLLSTDLKPDGSTALYESACTVIDRTGDLLKEMKEYRPGFVIFVIFTDGMENASTGIYSGESGRILLKQKIEHQQTKYNWTFFFLGANIDAIGTGESIGIQPELCINYQSSKDGCNNVFRSASNAVSRLRSTNPSCDKSTSVKFAAFTDCERYESMAQDKTPPKITKTWPLPHHR